MSTEDILTTVAPDLLPDPALKEMLDAGVFLGCIKTKTNPKMKPYILTNRNNVEIINLEMTTELLERAVEFIKREAKRGAHILLAGVQPAATDAVNKLAAEFNLPVVVTRWLGGTLTNFKIIFKRIEYYKKLKADWAAGVFHKYTKKEQVDTERELQKLTTEMGSLEPMSTRPELLIVIDPRVHNTAIREAKRLKIPVVAFANTDADPDEINYLVPGNSKARMSIFWFIDKIAAAIRDGRREMVLAKESDAKFAEEAKA